MPVLVRYSGLLRRLVGRLTRFVMLAMVIGIMWGSGLVWFVRTIPDAVPDPLSESARRGTDAIVVLTGGSERLVTGLELLARGRAEKLFVSGVHEGVDLSELLRAANPAPEFEFGELGCRIVLGYAAGNTVGNAVETAEWMRAEHFRSLRLVTANYHMRRSLLEFRMAMPEAEVIPHPVVPPHVPLNDWWSRRNTALLLATEYTKYLVAVARFWVNQSLDS